MAIFALTSTIVEINGQNYSNYCKSATLTVDAAQLDSTDFASAGWTEVIGGLKSGTLSLEFMDDFAVGEIDADLWPFLGTVQTFRVRPTDAVVGTSNPNYNGSVLITTHTIGGSVGDIAGKSLSFPTTGAITRATSG